MSATISRTCKFGSLDVVRAVNVDDYYRYGRGGHIGPGAVHPFDQELDISRNASNGPRVFDDYCGITRDFYGGVAATRAGLATSRAEQLISIVYLPSRRTDLDFRTDTLLNINFNDYRTILVNTNIHSSSTTAHRTIVPYAITMINLDGC